MTRAGAPPRREVGLALGQFLLAPLVGFWIGALVVFLLLAAIGFVRWDFNPEFGTPATAVLMMIVLLGIPFLLPTAAAIAVAIDLRGGGPRARRKARLLAGACLAAIVNATFWTGVAAPRSGHSAAALFDPVLFVAAVVAFAWSAFVLSRTRPVPVGFRLPRAPSPIVRGVMVAGAVAVAAVFVGGVLAARTRLFFGREILGDGQVLWGGERAYVCATRTSMAADDSLLNAILDYRPVFLGPPSRDELVVAEVGPESMSTRLLVGFPPGQCYVYRGALHYHSTLPASFSYGGKTPGEITRFHIEHDRKWEDGVFKDLSDGEKARMVEDVLPHGSLEGLAAADGWQAASRPRGLVSFALGGTPVKVRFDREEGVPEARFQRVAVTIGEAPERLLLLVRGGDHLTSESAYEAIHATTKGSAPQ